MLDPDVAAKLKRSAEKSGKPLKAIVNSALRIGLGQLVLRSAAKPYRTKPHPLGLKQGLSYDNIADLLDPA